MGLGTEEMLLLLETFLKKSNYVQGVDGRTDMMIQYLKTLLMTSEKSYIQGVMDGYLFGIVKDYSSEGCLKKIGLVQDKI